MILSYGNSSYFVRNLLVISVILASASTNVFGLPPMALNADPNTGTNANGKTPGKWAPVSSAALNMLPFIVGSMMVNSNIMKMTNGWNSDPGFDKQIAEGKKVLESKDYYRNAALQNQELAALTSQFTNENLLPVTTNTGEANYLLESSPF
jgi:hypothetical protein